MGDWRSQFPILSTTTHTPPQTLSRRDLLVSETMRVDLYLLKKVAAPKRQHGEEQKQSSQGSRPVSSVAPGGRAIRVRGPTRVRRRQTQSISFASFFASTSTLGVAFCAAL